jgi:hypothetical protein
MGCPRNVNAKSINICSSEILLMAPVHFFKMVTSLKEFLCVVFLVMRLVK